MVNLKTVWVNIMLIMPTKQSLFVFNSWTHILWSCKVCVHTSPLESLLHTVQPSLGTVSVAVSLSLGLKVVWVVRGRDKSWREWRSASVEGWTEDRLRNDSHSAFSFRRVPLFIWRHSFVTQTSLNSFVVLHFNHIPPPLNVFWFTFLDMCLNVTAATEPYLNLGDYFHSGSGL